jgi:hypothetical protein
VNTGPVQPASVNSPIKKPTLEGRFFVSTLAPESIASPAAYTTPTADHLMDAPLAALLAEFDVAVSEIDAEPGFTGGAYVRGDHSLVFVKPTRRPAVEWELMARAMLGKVLRVRLPELPEPYQLTEL